MKTTSKVLQVWYFKGINKQWVGQTVWALQQQELESLVLPSSYSTGAKEKTTVKPANQEGMKTQETTVPGGYQNSRGESLSKKLKTYECIHLEISK